MKNYKSITWRYIKGQRNRTLLTIFGIILSIALITAIGTMVVSARGALVKEAIRENGSFHARFRYIDEDQIKKLENHIGVEKLGKTKLVGTLALKETTEEERDNGGRDIPYRSIDLKEYDDNAKAMLPIRLIEGRLPENKDEIVIEKWTREFFKEDLKVGDTISLPIGNRIEAEKNHPDEMTRETFENIGEKEFKIVGFTTPRFIWRGNLLTEGIIGNEDNSVTGEGDYYGFITVPEVKGANSKIIKIAEDIGVGEENILYNNDLLRLSAESVNETFNSSILGILVFVVGLIMISTIAVIYNAFNISVIERISQFGLLRSVGATPKQIRSLVYKEAAIFTAIAIPLGLVSGVFAMKVVLYVISLIQDDIQLFKDMEITISPIVFLISSLLGAITVFLSARGPARRAGSVSPLEAIRNTEDTKKENFKRAKHTGLIKKIFGIEGEIAYKNLRRNKKRFIITVFSMVLSIVLFITFSSFSNFLYQSGIIDTADMADYEVTGNFGENEEEIYDRLKLSEDINRIYTLTTDSGSVNLEKGQIKQSLIDTTTNIIADEKDGKIQINNIDIMSIGDENLDVLDELLKQGNIDKEAMDKKNGVLVVNRTYAFDKNGNARPLMEGYNLKPGDKVPFYSYSSGEIEENPNYEDLEVVGVLEKGILGREYNFNGGINMITTEKVLDELSKENDNPYITMYIEAKKDGNKENISKLLMELEDDTPGLRVVDYAEQAQEMRNMTIIMSIFLYGFVTIISLISAINIINTISTNIILRTREIAMIKAVGMTNSGIKKMVAFESIFYGLYASIFGTIIGAGLSYVLFRLVGGISEFEYVFPLKNVIIATVGALVIAILSGVYPLKRINDKIIVESMKETN